MSERNLRLILGSSSPQRRELLTQAGYRFRIVQPDPGAECGVCSRESPGEMVARLARQKAADVAEQLAKQLRADELSDELIVACDTVAECAGSILGKPTDRAHARQMLRLLSGREDARGLHAHAVARPEGNEPLEHLRYREGRIDARGSGCGRAGARSRA